MANRGYDVVVDVDAEGDLGHTDLQEDLEFHSSTFDDNPQRSKIPADTSNPFGTPSNSTISSKRYLWSLSFYAQFFDVDTSEVLRRCRVALIPRANFLDILDGNPDLYGPFWIATTVIFILFLTGTISRYLAIKGEEDFQYNFTLLTAASGLIYGYTFILPVALWGVLRWFGSEGANVLECWALYGYGNLIWIAVALISWSTFNKLNWVFVALGFAVSSLFLVRNLYPLVSATDKKVSQVLLIVVVVLHAGLAIAIKEFFFPYGSHVQKNSPADENPMEPTFRL
ncbi:hypothetical protein MMC30_006959 [Trapelia coarctata]|nr:hypothetical protein [Trapelia coarctata]